MDKFEYKVRAEEIKSLIAQGDYVQAAELADGIDWRRVKSVMMLCTISDLYKINRRYEDAIALLLLAYDRHPGGRTIVYSLCELSIKMEEFVQAVEYYKEFVQIAPRDTGRYILQYKLYEAQDVGLEERIAVLEELKKRDYREKWAYELAYLYHRVGLSTRCVEECDELILWFGEGKYVTKAMELKMLHQPLTAQQQQRYDYRFQHKEEPVYEQPAGDGSEDGRTYQDGRGYEADQAYQNGQEYGAEQGYQDGQFYGTGQPYQGGQSYENGQGYQNGQFYENSQPYQDGQSYENGQEYQDSQFYGTGQPYQGGQSYENGQGYQDGQSYENGQGYQDGQSYESGQGYQNGQFYENNQPYQDGQSYENGQGYQNDQFYGTGQPYQDGQSYENGQGYQDGQFYGTSQPYQDGRFYENGQGYDDGQGNGNDQPYQNGEFYGNNQPYQDAQYYGNSRFEQNDRIYTNNDQAKPGQEEEELDIQVKTMDVSQYNTINLQKELAEGLKEVLGEEPMIEDPVTRDIVAPMFEADTESQNMPQMEEPEKEMPESELQHSEVFFEESFGEDFAETGKNFTHLGEMRAEEPQEGSEPEDHKEPEESSEPDVQEAGEDSETVGDSSDMEEQVKTVSEEETRLKKLADVIAAEADGQLGAVVPGVAGMEPQVTGQLSVEDILTEWEAIRRDREEPQEEADGVEELAEIEENCPEENASDAILTEETFTAEGDFAEAAFEAEGEIEEEIIEETAGEEPAEAFIEESAEELPEEEFSEEAEEEELPEEESSDEAEEEELPEESAEELKTEQKTTVKEKHLEKEKLPARERPSIEHEKPHVRNLTKEEKELFAPFIQNRAARVKLVAALDRISLAAYTGNVIITGDEGMDTLNLAKNMIRDVQMMDSNFSGKTAKISGAALNQKNVTVILEQLKNGALIIQKAFDINEKTANTMYKKLQQESLGIIVVIEDTRKRMDKFLAKNKKLAECFNARMDMEALSNEALVAFGKKYARNMEHSIDELGILALHTRIEDMQTIDHAVTIMEVQAIVDEAIKHAGRKTFKHFLDVLLAKRYDEEDMIILREDDFV